MAFNLYREDLSFPIIAASAINPKQPVKLIGSSVLMVIPAATNADRPFGFNGLASAGASGINSQDALTVYEEGNYVKAIALASVGVGAEVAVGSNNGALSPAALVSASGHWACGISVTPAGAGETFTILVKPRKA